MRQLGTVSSPPQNAVRILSRRQPSQTFHPPKYRAQYSATQCTKASALFHNVMAEVAANFVKSAHCDKICCAKKRGVCKLELRVRRQLAPSPMMHCVAYIVFTSMSKIRTKTRVQLSKIYLISELKYRRLSEWISNLLSFVSSDNGFNHKATGATNFTLNIEKTRTIAFNP